MSTLAKRLTALENIMSPPRVGPLRIYSVCGAGTEEEAAEFVRGEGWAFDDDTDMMIRIVPLAVDFRDDHVWGEKPCEDPELNRLRFMHQPKNPEWRRDL